jgi:hypothetical protein
MRPPKKHCYSLRSSSRGATHWVGVGGSFEDKGKFPHLTHVVTDELDPVFVTDNGETVWHPNWVLTHRDVVSVEGRYLGYFDSSSDEETDEGLGVPPCDVPLAYSYEDSQREGFKPSFGSEFDSIPGEEM